MFDLLKSFPWLPTRLTSEVTGEGRTDAVGTLDTIYPVGEESTP